MASMSQDPPSTPGTTAATAVEPSAVVDRYQRASVVEAYGKRAPYPPGVDEILLELLGNEPRSVLDLGCGPGTIARRLAPRVARVDAVDLSPRMIAEGQRLPGGEHAALRWICGAAEEVPLTGPYGLITAGKSLHWMRCEVVLPRCRSLLSAGGVLAIVDATRQVPWKERESRLLAAYATVRDHLPADLPGELERRQLFRRLGVRTTEDMVIRQTVADYIDSFHSKEAFCREDLGSEQVAAFQRDFQRLLAEHAEDGQLVFAVRGRVIWGRPT